MVAIGFAGLSARGETAGDILKRRLDLENGVRRWTDRHEAITMRLVGPGRDESRVFEIDTYEKRSADGRYATVAFLRAPADVHGTAVLGLRDPGQPLRQWLYLPWSKTTRRISRPAGEAFMGSDLTYGDLDLLRLIPTWSSSDATATLLRDEAVDGRRAHVLALVPKRADVEYARVVLWLDADDLIARRIDFHTDDSDAQKRVLQAEIRETGGVPVPRKIAVETVGAHTRTEITVTDVGLNQGLDDALFTQSALARGKP